MPLISYQGSRMWRRQVFKQLSRQRALDELRDTVT